MKKLFLLLALSLTSIFAAQANKPFVIHVQCPTAETFNVTITPDDISKPYFALCAPVVMMGGLDPESFSVLLCQQFSYTQLLEQGMIHAGVYPYSADEDEGSIIEGTSYTVAAYYIDFEKNKTSECVSLTFMIAEGLDITSEDVDDGIEEINADANLGGSSKLLHEGHLYILRDGKIFNAQGARVR